MSSTICGVREAQISSGGLFASLSGGLRDPLSIVLSVQKESDSGRNEYQARQEILQQEIVRYEVNRLVRGGEIIAAEIARADLLRSEVTRQLQVAFLSGSLLSPRNPAVTYPNPLGSRTPKFISLN